MSLEGTLLRRKVEEAEERLRKRDQIIADLHAELIAMKEQLKQAEHTINVLRLSNKPPC